MLENFLTPESLKNGLAAGAMMLLPICVAFKRSGQSPFLGALALIPHAGLIICLILLGIKRWPNEPPKPVKAEANTKTQSEGA